MTFALLRPATVGRRVFGKVEVASWAVSKLGGNPVIDVTNNPNETVEQYTPAPIRVANGDIWVYVKGTSRIYGWKSTDGGETFTLQNSNNAVLTPGAAATWDESFVVEPAAVYDEDTDTIHLWYGGRASAGDSTWAWGHATAPGTTPTVFTKDAANPILTSATVSAALGGAAMSDLKIEDVVMIDGDFHFFGYCRYNSIYRIIRCTGSTWNNPSGVEILLTASASPFHVVQGCCAFRLPGWLKPRYSMLYAIGGDLGSDPRRIRAAFSDDGQTWTFDTATVISLGSGWESSAVYEPAVLKETTAPYQLPLRDSTGRLRCYYSGYDTADSSANVGLAYITPSPTSP